jgi:hypothetical protein
MTEPAAADMTTWSRTSVARRFSVPRKRELCASLVNRWGVPTWRNGPRPCRSRKLPPNVIVGIVPLGMVSSWITLTKIRRTHEGFPPASYETGRGEAVPLYWLQPDQIGQQPTGDEGKAMTDGNLAPAQLHMASPQGGLAGTTTRGRKLRLGLL